MEYHVLLRSVVSDSLWPHGLQHIRIPCPPSLRACSNSCPLSRCCHSTILSSVIPFSSCFQSSPTSGSVPKGWLFSSGGRSTEASASASVLPMSIQDWFPLGLTGLISLQSKGVSRVFSSTTVHSSKASILQRSFFFTVQLSHLYITSGKTIPLTIWGKWNRERLRNIPKVTQFVKVWVRIWAQAIWSTFLATKLYTWELH